MYIETIISQAMLSSSLKAIPFSLLGDINVCYERN